MEFERKLHTEQQDIADIVAGILAVQARFAKQQKRPLGRGTHTKGVCVRATFEVFDVAKVVNDPAVAARLARGLFAKPGVYPARVRFANAASTIRADSAPDVRALSFAIDIPAGLLGDEAVRLDYSMNDASTFPINDAHAFAAFMRVQGAAGVLGQLKALVSLSFADLIGFFQTAVRGVRQQRVKIHPYQQTRYWSNVAFLHGQDAAVKYSAIPAATNPGRPIGKGQNVLRDELVRHINDDPQMASFDVALQLLDADRMTFKGESRDPSFWIENASVEWPEGQSPFQVVGRLTLARASLLPPEECEAWFIDVTKYSLPDARPLGSINRARWVAESASRKARRGSAPSPAASTADARRSPVAVARGLSHRLASITIGSIVKAVVLVAVAVALSAALLGLFTIFYTDRGGGMLPPEHLDAVVYPDQGWGPGMEAPARQTFYYTPQGAVLKDMRYNWFVNLEMPWGTSRFASPDVLRRYGFLVDGQTAANPDSLPVGFTKHFDPQANEVMLDITCAACHTGQVNVTRNSRTTALRIDGGSALHAFTDASFGHFVPTMVASMLSTATNPFKFNRFARRVLGDRYPQGRWALHREFCAVMGAFLDMGWNEKWHGLVPTEEGYGRTDALARIANTVFGDHIQASNYAVGNAPVNYPAVWNIWKFDWVQYNASVSQPMARNIGESMGTGAKYALINMYGGPLPPDQRFRSSSIIENLSAIEQTLRKLQPPPWNESVLGPIDRAKAERGKALFNQHCVACHGPHIAPPALKMRNSPLKGTNQPEWIVKTLCIDDIGTDPNTAANFYDARIDLTKTGLTAADLRVVARRSLEIWKQRQTAYLTGEIAQLQAQGTSGAAQVASLQQQLGGLDANIAQQLSQIDPASLPAGSALSYLGTMIREKAYADRGYTAQQQAELDGFGSLDLPQVIPAYKPRPLAGMWATPPYLHNGSVPTIYDLLSPVAERPKTFRVGSREFDTVKVGLKEQTSGYWVFDTSKDGNHNTGHEFNAGYKPWAEGDPPAHGLIGPYLPPEDRLAIIEHLKVRNDDVDGPQEPNVPSSAACAPPPPRSDATHRIVR
ncbi:MAG TPA: di-heme-cytochrome C peroxidase [Vicinamibacterales bacterium]|nr:di-heme-cytochrome C peroxidase [Vicinamibacterales bacterium]